MYYNDTLLLTPAEILVSSVDTEGHIHRLSRDRRHNLFGFNSQPYLSLLESDRPTDHIFIDVLSNYKCFLIILGDDDIEGTNPGFVITGLNIVTERVYYCMDEIGNHVVIGTWRYFPCPEGTSGFIRSQCIMHEDEPVWRTNSTHCVTEAHSRYETVIRWTYQIEEMRASMGEWILEDSAERLSELVSFALHKNLREFVIFGVKERCSMINLQTLGVDYYSKMNCIQYSIHTRVPSSYRTDLWSLIALQEDVFCDALNRQYPNERFVCHNIELNGSISFSENPSSIVLPVVVGCVLLLSVIIALIVYRHRIAAFVRRRNQRRKALREMNSKITETLAIPFIQPAFSSPNSVVYSTPQGFLYCDQVVRLGDSFVLSVC